VRRRSAATREQVLEFELMIRRLAQVKLRQRRLIAPVSVRETDMRLVAGRDVDWQPEN
jgi:hypothetical protein